MKTILVCGCSSGIGEHLFNWYNFHTHYDTYGLSRTKMIECDATDAVRVTDIMSRIRPAILINCVGQASMNLALLSSSAAFDRTVANNMKSTFLLCREAGKQMLRNKWGRIINFGSCAVSMEIEGESLYAASKAAANTFSRILARELAPHITVNTISCGPVDTRLIRSLDSDKVQAVVNRQIIKKYTEFEEIRRVCDFLISEDSGMITGQNIYINGAG